MQDPFRSRHFPYQDCQHRKFHQHQDDIFASEVQNVYHLEKFCHVKKVRCWRISRGGGGQDLLLHTVPILLLSFHSMTAVLLEIRS
jgi:hypothetical protein